MSADPDQDRFISRCARLISRTDETNPMILLTTSVGCLLSFMREERDLDSISDAEITKWLEEGQRTLEALLMDRYRVGSAGE